MPLYEYHCEPCNERFEVLRAMSRGSDPATCPSCGGEDARRVLSVFAAITAGGPSGASDIGPLPMAGGGGSCCGGACGCG